jgi:hypothetical protein
MTMSRVVHWVRGAVAAARVAFLVAYVWPVLDPVLNRTAAGSLGGRATAYVIGLAVGAVGLGSVAMLDAEWATRRQTITTFGDALWWATSIRRSDTATRVPVTLEGRLIAFALMLVGISLVSVVATWWSQSWSAFRRRAGAGPAADPRSQGARAALLLRLPVGSQPGWPGTRESCGSGMLSSGSSVFWSST